MSQTEKYHSFFLTYFRTYNSQSLVPSLYTIFFQVTQTFLSFSFDTLVSTNDSFLVTISMTYAIKRRKCLLHRHFFNTHAYLLEIPMLQRGTHYRFNFTGEIHPPRRLYFQETLPILASNT